MLKLLCCFLIVAGTGYVGYSVSGYYKKREQFFSDLVDFLSYANTQISFFQNRLSQIFMGFEGTGTELKDLLQAKAKHIENPSLQDAKKPIFLTKDEWQWIDGFLNALGKTDADSECGNIAAMLDKATTAKQKSASESMKKCGAATKLGFALGLAIAIIIV